MTVSAHASAAVSAGAACPPALIRELQRLLGERNVLHLPEDVLVYEYDYGLDRAAPGAVVFPRTTAEVAEVAGLAARYGVPIVARGAGTGITGGAVPVDGGVLVALSRLNRILTRDYDDRLARVEPGVVNLAVSTAVEADGYFFAPDPSSQKASTIGGNVGNSAGGPHCLAYGTMANHVLGLELVLAGGETLELGGAAPDGPGYDLTGLVVGSEGTLGLATRVTLRLTRQPEAVRTFLAVFDGVRAASNAVSDIIAEGLIPAALELMDRVALQAIEAAFRAGYPPEAGAVLLIEVDGLAEKVEAESALIEQLCLEHGAIRFEAAASAEARAKLWAARKGAASAMGRIAPNYYLHDCVVARSKLPGVLAKVIEIGQAYELPVANLFHAGDGNLHPMIMFDAREPGASERVMQAGREMLQACVEAGGTLSGEHGIGVEKNAFMPWIFSEADLEVMDRVRSAFDPGRLMNPGKLLPSGAGCADDAARPQGVRPGEARQAATHRPDLWV